jgi:hypothetical protein
MGAAGVICTNILNDIYSTTHATTTTKNRVTTTPTATTTTTITTTVYDSFNMLLAF